MSASDFQKKTLIIGEMAFQHHPICLHFPMTEDHEYSDSEKLELIKSMFGIGRMHLAKMLGVDQSIVNAWIKAEKIPAEKNRERIQELLELAEFWQSLCIYPLSRRVSSKTETGDQFLDLFASKSLDVKKIKAALEYLASEENDRSARLKEKAVAMRKRMKAKGIKPLPEWIVDQSLRDMCR